MIPNWWPAIVFGAPGLIVSLVVSSVGIRAGKPILLCVGAVLSLPSAYYIGGIPGWFPALLVLPALHLIAALAVGRSRRSLAACLLLPSALAAVVLAAVTALNVSRDL